MRVRPWSTGSDLAFLLVSGGHDDRRGMPGADVVASWMDGLAAAGYARVRTNALAPGLAASFAGAGFVLSQSLDLLSRPLEGVRRLPVPSRRVRRGTRIGTFARGWARDIVECDVAAFGPEWAMDGQSLRDALAATTVSRLFTVGERSLEGFCVAGATGDTGYVQRLAVRPEHQRRGAGTALLCAATSWLGSVRCTSAIVNTETDNEPALALYRRHGFASVGRLLSVMERDL